MANYKNTRFYSISNDKQTIPASSNKTGTIATNGRFVKGTSTLFTTEMRVGSWLTDLTNNEIRRVVRVKSDTLAELDYGFTSNIVAGTTPNVIVPTDLNIREISVAIPLQDAGGIPYTFGTIDGVTLQNGLPTTYGKTSAYKTDRGGLIDPIIADATGTLMNVTILK